MTIELCICSTPIVGLYGMGTKSRPNFPFAMGCGSRQPIRLRQTRRPTSEPNRWIFSHRLAEVAGVNGDGHAGSRISYSGQKMKMSFGKPTCLAGIHLPWWSVISVPDYRRANILRCCVRPKIWRRGVGTNLHTEHDGKLHERNSYATATSRMVRLCLSLVLWAAKWLSVGSMRTVRLHGSSRS